MDALSIVTAVIAIVVGFVIVGVVAYVRAAGRSERATERRFTDLEVQVAVLRQQVRHLEESLQRVEAERDECRAEAKKLQAANGKLQAEIASLSRPEPVTPPTPPPKAQMSARQKNSAMRRLQTMKDELALLEEQITAQGGAQVAPAQLVLRRDNLEEEIVSTERVLDGA